MKTIWLWTLSLIVLVSLAFPTGRTAAYPDGNKALFMEPVSGALPEWGSSVALDGTGGIHVAMQFEVKNGSTLTHPIYYVYCAAGCGTASSWKWVLLGDTLQYGSNGHPKEPSPPKACCG